MVSKMSERLKQLGDASPPERREPNLKICVWCANRSGEACMASCGPEGKYRYLAPDTRPVWEAPPRLPPLRDIVDWPPAERLAMLWLVIYYQGEEGSSAGGS